MKARELLRPFCVKKKRILFLSSPSEFPQQIPPPKGRRQLLQRHSVFAIAGVKGSECVFNGLASRLVVGFFFILKRLLQVLEISMRHFRQG